MLVLLFSQFAIQTDWYGGPGVLGPVSSWGTTFYSQTGVSYANPGRVSLVAISWMFSSWLRHTIDNGSLHHYQGFMAYDIDNDGYKDLVLNSDNWVRWYEYVSDWNFTLHNIAYISGLNYPYSAVWADDMDGDGDGDVVAGGPYVGLYYCRNDGGTWNVSQITTRGIFRLFTADVDGDGDVDIVASARSWPSAPGIWWYENTGAGFVEHTIWLPGLDIWRFALGDLDLDGDVDIAATGCCADGRPHVLINDGSGNFTHYAIDPSLSCVDGMWLNDLDLDGDLDITVAQYTGNYHFYAYLNSGNGTSYTLLDLNCGSQYYMDGSIAYDMDIDGLPDIVGTNQYVGYFRQNWWPNFSEYRVYDYGSLYYAHWVYPDDLDQQTCAPDIDILVSGNGTHDIFENRMVASYTPQGELVSSILDMTGDPNLGGQLTWMGWGGETCIPTDTAITIYYRTGRTVAEIQAAPWQLAVQIPAGHNEDSVQVSSGCVRYLQYKIELVADTAHRDIPTLGEIWFRWTPCPLYQSDQEQPGPSDFSLRVQGKRLILEVPVNARVNLSIYGLAGRLAKELVNGALEPGRYTYELDLPPGVYVALLKTDRVSITKKVSIR